MVIGITEESCISDHKGRITASPEVQVVAPIYARQPTKGGRAFYWKIATRLEGGQGPLEQQARAQVRYEGNEVSTIRPSAAQEGRISLASTVIRK